MGFGRPLDGRPLDGRHARLGCLTLSFSTLKQLLWFGWDVPRPSTGSRQRVGSTGSEALRRCTCTAADVGVQQGRHSVGGDPRVAMPCVTSYPRSRALLLPVCLQTYIGSIIASVNPYQPIAGLYEGATMERYSRHHLGELPPHIFAVANECYRCLWKRHDNQCVLIR